ncbi:MAG: helix-turn-helix domain-containing protein [Chromatiaceae bacterium]|nr:helix-turn-helix domain-containing protein [Chromatiaceae bacterium]
MRPIKASELRSDVEAVFERLSSIVGVSTDTGIAKRLGISPQAIYNARKRGTIPYEKILQFARTEKIDLNYLLFGVEATAAVDIQLLGTVAASLRTAARGANQEKLARSLSMIGRLYNHVLKRLPPVADMESPEIVDVIKQCAELYLGNEDTEILQ